MTFYHLYVVVCVDANHDMKYRLSHGIPWVSSPFSFSAGGKESASVQLKWRYLPDLGDFVSCWRVIIAKCSNVFSKKFFSRRSQEKYVCISYFSRLTRWTGAKVKVYKIWLNRRRIAKLRSIFKSFEESVVHSNKTNSC